MLKVIGYSLLGLLIITVVGATILSVKFEERFFGEVPNNLVVTHDAAPIKFQWRTDSFAQHFEPHVAIMIPVMIKGFSNKFYFQLDTGTPHTVIYGKPLQSLLDHSLQANIVKDDNGILLEGLSVDLGGSSLDFASVKVMPGYGRLIDWQDTLNGVSLGTIGTDFIEGKVAVIDYVEQYIRLYDDRPDWMEQLSTFRPFEFKGRRLLLPAQIDGDKQKLLFDTGCSSFGLITSRHQFRRHTNAKDQEIVFDANRWGDALPIHHKPTDKQLLLGGGELPLGRISYVDRFAPLQRFMTPFTPVSGWLGNKPFVESVLIIDAKDQVFTVVDSTLP